MRLTKFFCLAFIFFELVSINFTCNCQELTITNNFKEKIKTAEIVVFGEVHSKKNAFHKSELVKVLNQERGIRYIAIEAPRIMQVYAQDYIENGNPIARKLFSKSIFKGFRKDYAAFLDSIRSFNTALHDSSKVVVKCFDLQSQSGVLSFDDIEDLINYLDKPLLNDLMNIISLSELSVGERQDKLYEKLQKNEAKFKEIMSSTDYYALLDYVKGIDIINNNGKVKLSNVALSKKREEFITENISNLYIRNEMKSLLVFAGDYHISKLENDDWLEHNTLALELSKTYDVLSVLTIYSKDSKFPYSIFNYDYTEILSIGYEELSRKYNSDEFILFGQDDEPQEKIFWKRYDGILLKFN